MEKVFNESEEGPQPPVYVICGAYSKSAIALAHLLFARGAVLAFVGRDAKKLALLSDYFDGSYYQADVSNFTEMEKCFAECLSTYGKIDGVANLAGSLLLKSAHGTTSGDWSRVVDANLTSAFVTVKYGAKAMMRSGGSIVLVSSAAARIGLPNHDAIAAAKAGVEGLARSAAATYARHDIRVNCVAPGLVDSEMTSQLISNAAQLEVSKKMHPLGRIGRADDVASAIDWLLSSKSSWVTGQCIAVDGGLSSIKPAEVRSLQSSESKASTGKN